MKCDKCGYDDKGTGDTAHICGPVSIREVTTVTPTQQQIINDLRMYADDTFSAAGHCDLATTLSQAADMLERYGQPEAVRAALTDAEIRKWWARDNGLEDCDLAKLDDFVQVVRAVEAAHGIGSKA